MIKNDSSQKTTSIHFLARRPCTLVFKHNYKNNLIQISPNSVLFLLYFYIFYLQIKKNINLIDCLSLLMYRLEIQPTKMLLFNSLPLLLFSSDVRRTRNLIVVALLLLFFRNVQSKQIVNLSIFIFSLTKGFFSLISSYS